VVIEREVTKKEMSMDRERQIFFSVIIPTLNESKAISGVLQKIPDFNRSKGEIIVVDASKDNTAVIAEKNGARVIKTKKRGKGYQIKIGVEHSRGRLLILMDGDGEHPPEYIERLIEELEKGYDIVLGTRNRVVFSKKPIMSILFYPYLIFMVFLFRMVGFSVRGTPLTGFRCLKRDAWDKMAIQSNNFLIEAEMNVRIAELGLKYGEVHIPFKERRKGIQDSRVLKSKSGRIIMKFTIATILKKLVRIFNTDN
jgi:glycosyltransferase involved in cell wall biosynthesis